MEYFRDIRKICVHYKDISVERYVRFGEMQFILGDSLSPNQRMHLVLNIPIE